MGQQRGIRQVEGAGGCCQPYHAEASRCSRWSRGNVSVCRRFACVTMNVDVYHILHRRFNLSKRWWRRLIRLLHSWRGGNYSFDSRSYETTLYPLMLTLTSNSCHLVSVIAGALPYMDRYMQSFWHHPAILSTSPCVTSPTRSLRLHLRPSLLTPTITPTLQATTPTTTNGNYESDSPPGLDKWVIDKR